MKNENLEFHLDCGQAKASCISTLSMIEPDGKMVVTIKKAKSIRSHAQNALYWGAWLPYISGQTGRSIADLHDDFKRCYMPMIYMAGAENKVQEEWCALYDLIKEDGTMIMIDRAKRTVSTVWATVSQFTKYLEMIEHFCADKQIGLPPDVHYKKAMGIK